MNRLFQSGLLAALAILLLTPRADALRDLSLKQQGELPRDLYVDLVDPEHYDLDKLVVQFSEDTRIRWRDGRFVSLEGRATTALDGFLKRHPGLKVERLFQGQDEETLDQYVASGERLSGYDVADLNNFYLLRVTDRSLDPKGLLLDLLTLELVQTCYYEPISIPATCGVDPAPVTPNYVASQDYREAAPTGIDIQYAWNHDPEYGNGLPTYYFCDLEWGWCETHEDYPSFSVIDGPDSTTPDFYNHGTAVVSIVGACDDGKGVTGLVPDTHMTGRVVSNSATTAEAIISIGTDLFVGETYLIEMHAQGPDPGTVCPCNCDQFRYIAEEYWTANFNAILANSANGRFCIEAAGNGSMDLDWAGYGGAFDPSVRDSHAILVGAGTSGSVHNPECFTNYGSRISAYGWGDGVYAAGYGYLVNPTGCEQDYTNSFSGTSSASPIVTGAAISLALIHKNRYGSYPSANTLRSRLQINGTPQGPTDPTHEISVLPNMRGILAPDLAPFTIGGWAGDIVPSDVTGTNTLPANLAPAPATTYTDVAWVNWSYYSSVALSESYLYRDDVLDATSGVANHAPYSAHYYSDFGLQVRGGLHYLRQQVDPNSLADESLESNNMSAIAYRWDPMPLSQGVPALYSRGPVRNPVGYSFTALDGFGNGGNFPGYWEAFAVMPSNGADYDIRLYTADPTPTTGWSTAAASSGYVNEVDFVGSNNNVVSDGDFAGVINYNNSSEFYTVEGDGSLWIGAPPSVQTLQGAYSLAAGEILDIFEMNVTSLTPIAFDFDVTSGIADIAVFVYGPTSTYYTRAGAQWTLNAGGAGVRERGLFTPTATGFHGIVVCKNLRTDLAQSSSYNLWWGPAVGDLTHTALSGWTAPVVARNSGGTTGVLPAILNEGASLGDAGLINIGQGTMTGGSNQAFYLDGPFVYASGDFGAVAAGATGSISGRSIGSVKGGRHELGSVLDYLSEVGEEPPAGESNNAYYAQYAWAPYTLTNSIAQSRSAAPNFANNNNPNAWLNPGYNQDGYRITTSLWTGAAAIPGVSSQMIDMVAYDNASTDPLTALTNPVLLDADMPGRITLAMFNGNVLGNVDRNVGVLNNVAYPTVVPSGNYTVQYSQRRSDLALGTPVVATLAAGATSGGEIIHTYDVYLIAGTSYPLTLFNNSTVNLGVAVFSAGLDYVGKGDALADFNTSGNGVDESGSFVPTTTGWHGVAVYRDGTADLGPAAAYSLVLGSWAPAAVVNLDIAMTETDGSDGVVHLDLQWPDVTTDSQGHPLTVDRYHVYWSFQPFSNWVYYSSPLVSELLNLPAAVSAETQIYFMVTAMDTNGTLVASSGPVPLGLEPGSASTPASVIGQRVGHMAPAGGDGQR